MTTLKKPIITEKATDQNEHGKYAFIVDNNANKVEIRKAVEDMYNVNVVDVNTINHKGKKKTRYTKSQILNGRTPSYKKAIVTLAEGEVIDFYSHI